MATGATANEGYGPRSLAAVETISRQSPRIASMLRATLDMYVATATRAARLTARGWPAAFVIVVYTAIVFAAGFFLGHLGIVGGFLMGFVECAVVSSFLAMVEQVANVGRLTRDDFTRSFGAYFWDVMGVLFLFWMISMAQNAIAAALPPSGQLAVGLAVAIGEFVFLNACPEIIYKRRLGSSLQGSLAVVSESAKFVQANWIEWFVPNFALAFLAILATPLFWAHGISGIAYLIPSLMNPLQAPILLAGPLLAGGLGLSLFLLPPFLLALLYAMVFRGLLFDELSRGSRRLRAFRARF